AGEAPGVVQERARRGAGVPPRRLHARDARRAGRRAHPDTRRPVRRRARRAGGGGGALDGGAVPLRRTRDVPRPRSPLPAPVSVGTRAVIFDMDGVLIDSGAHHRAAWRALLDELGVAPLAPDSWRLTIGRPSVEAVPLLLGRPLSWAEAQRLAARKQEHYRRLVTGGPRPRPPPPARLPH